MKNGSVLLVTPLAAAVFAAGGQAYAQQSTTSEVEELYVVGQRLEETTPQQLAQFGNRLEMLTADDVRLGGFNDLSQALQMNVPGLYVAPKNGAFDYVHCSLQGSRCSDVLWLVDGVRTTNRLYDTTTQLDTIPAHTIERIEILYGGQGIFYGTQAVAGVVNIVTRSFSNEPTGGFSVGFDEYNGTHLSGDFRTSFGRHQLALFGERHESDGFQPFPDEDYQPSATDRKRGYELLTLGVKYAYDFTPDSRLTLLYQRTDNELDFALPQWIAERYNARVEDWLTLKWDYAAGDNVDLYVKAYWHDWDTKWTDIRNDVSNGELTGQTSTIFQDAFWGFEDYGVTAVAEIRTENSFEFAVGYDYQRFWGADEVWLIEDKTETAQAVYGQIRTSRQQLENTHLAFGARYNTTTGNADGSVWNFSGQHDFSDRFFVRGQIGTSFRLPDAEELYLNDCCEVGNPNLKAEEGRNVEVGIGGAASRLNWQFTVFDREIDKLIQVDFDNPDFPDGRFENFDDTLETRGWQADFNVALSRALVLSLNYTRNESEFKSSSQQAQNIPESVAKLALGYRDDGTPFEMNVAVLRVGDVYGIPHSSIGRIDHGNYTVVDIGAGYFIDADRRHRIGLRVENALDEDYATRIERGRLDLDGSSYPARHRGTPRTLHASYNYRF